MYRDARVPTRLTTHACRRSYVALGLLGLVALTAVSAQPFKFTPAEYQPELTEAAQRVKSNYTGFVFDFANATVRLGTADRQASRRTVWCTGGSNARTWMLVRISPDVALADLLMGSARAPQT